MHTRPIGGPRVYNFWQDFQEISTELLHQHFMRLCCIVLFVETKVFKNTCSPSANLDIPPTLPGSGSFLATVVPFMGRWLWLFPSWWLSLGPPTPSICSHWNNASQETASCLFKNLHCLCLSGDITARLLAWVAKSCSLQVSNHLYFADEKTNVLTQLPWGGGQLLEKLGFLSREVCSPVCEFSYLTALCVPAESFLGSIILFAHTESLSCRHLE